MIFGHCRSRGRGRDCGGRVHGSLEVDVDLMEADRVPLRKAPDNVGIVDVAITSSESAGRNSDVLSGHNYLILVLLPYLVLLEFFICYSLLFHGCTVTGV